MPHYLLIVNPTSGRGFAGRSLPIIEQEMKKYGLDYKLVLTERPWLTFWLLTMSVLKLKKIKVPVPRIMMTANANAIFERLRFTCFVSSFISVFMENQFFLKKHILKLTIVTRNNDTAS